MPEQTASKPATTDPANADRPLAPVYPSVIEMIGNTPMLELSRLDFGPCRVFGKLELMNPAGSIKDRIGLSMIEAAERDGIIDPAGEPKPTLIEATAGNTGLGLALIASQRGYKLVVVVPDKMSEGKIQHLRAMGAEVITARSDVTKGHEDYYQEVAARLAERTSNSFYVNQFANEANVQAHYEHTGPEMWEQVRQATGGAAIDAVVLGVGSGGTLSGVGRFLRERNPDVKIILADPAGSVLHPLVNEGKKVEPGSWLVEGMGEDFVPDICDLELCDEAVPVEDAEAFHTARELLHKEGMLSGSSTGCLVHATKVWCQKQSKPMNVVTLICDSGAKYLSKMFNDYWMIDQGFIERERAGDLRDLIARRHTYREDYSLGPDEPLQRAVTLMRLYDISQIAVVSPVRGDDPDQIVGIIDESDILLALSHKDVDLQRPVSDFMTARLETVKPSTRIEDLIPIFRADRVAIVVDDDGVYLGLITKIDLINYLRLQLPT